MTAIVPGQIIHRRYKLQKQLGHKPGRQTWLAQDIDNNETPVVVKILTLGQEARWEEFKLFEREGRVLQQLSHLRIPQAVDVFSLDEETVCFGLVHSYIPGYSLKELLQAGKRFSPQQVKEMARSALQILVYLHELSPPVLHRDIKPSNLILGIDEQLYLIDFGAAQNQAAMEGKTFTVVGTYGYTPMEQYGGRAVPASDLYSLGATLIHLLTGNAPIDLPQTEQGIQFQNYISGDQAFVNWVTKLAHPLLTQRFFSAQEALKNLETGISGSQEKTAPVRVIRPYGSQVKVRISSQGLEIELPYLQPPLLKVLLNPIILVVVWYFMFYATLQALVVILPNVAGVFWFCTFFMGIFLPLFLVERVKKLTTYLLRINHIQKILIDQKYFQITCQFGSIRYWQRKRAIGKLKQVYAERATILLRGELCHFRIAEELGLHPEELRWLAQEIDYWGRNCREL